MVGHDRVLSNRSSAAWKRWTFSWDASPTGSETGGIKCCSPPIIGNFRRYVQHDKKTQKVLLDKDGSQGKDKPLAESRFLCHLRIRKEPVSRDHALVTERHFKLDGDLHRASGLFLPAGL